MTSSSQGASVEVMGGPVRYWEGGEGPTLVFLHGAGSIGESWVGAFPLLSRDSRVLLPDLPGFGLSPDNPKLRTFRDLGAACLEFVERTARGPVDLLGNSMGGGLAAGIALERPDLFRSLVLIAPGGLHPREDVATEVKRVLPGELNRAVFQHPERVAREFPKLRPEEVRARRATTRAALARWFSGGLDPLPYQRLRVPTLVVWGREDRILPVAWAEEIARGIPGARAAVLEDCGHAPHLELPEQFTDLVRAFHAKLPPARSLSPRVGA